MQFNRDGTKYAKELNRRTKENLDNYQGPYEVTQLINSMVGMLVIPRQIYLQNLENVPFDSALLQRLQTCCVQNQLLTLDKIVRRMRNAICHGHLEFCADSNNNIERVVFKDTRQTPIFEMDISIDLLRDFVDALSAAIATFPDRRAQ